MINIPVIIENTAFIAIVIAAIAFEQNWFIPVC